MLVTTLNSNYPIANDTQMFLVTEISRPLTIPAPLKNNNNKQTKNNNNNKTTDKTLTHEKDTVMGKEWEKSFEVNNADCNV